jgi:Uma2 family endonuclease
MAVQHKMTTVEEFEGFEALPENRDRRFELINGEVFEKMPTEEHGVIALIIAAAFYSYLKSHPIGRAGIEVRHRMPDDDHNAFLPDISINLDTDRPIVKKGAVPRMPDLAIEVKSPDDAFTELRVKAKYYLEHGTRLVWLVYPEQRIVEVLAHGVDARTLTERDVLDGGDLLPDFSLAVSEIFAG